MREGVIVLLPLFEHEVPFFGLTAVKVSRFSFIFLLGKHQRKYE